MAADKGLWLHIYPYGIPFTGTVEYTGDDTSYYYDEYYEFSSEDLMNPGGSSGFSSVYGGEFGTGKDIRITITACGKEFSWDAKSVDGSNIQLFLDVPEECLVRPTTTITVSLEEASSTIKVKSLKTGKEYTDIDTSDNSYFSVRNVSVCEYIEITAPGHKPTRGFVTPSTRPFTDLEVNFSMNKTTDTLPSALYAWENPNVLSKITTYYAWISDTSDSYSQVLYTLAQEPEDGLNSEGYVKLFYFDSNCNLIDVSDQSDSAYYIKDLSGTYYNRDPNYDIYINEGADSIYYTTNTVINSGDVLYNNLGEDSGMKIGTVNSEGSFKVESEVDTYTLTINCTSIQNLDATDFVVTEVETGTILYTASDLATPATVTIDFPKTSTIKITNLIVANPLMSGIGCYELSVTNCSETHDSISDNGISYSAFYNNVVLSNFTGNPTVNLQFENGKV